MNLTDDIPLELLLRVRGEFAEMLGLCLTPGQAARLLGLDEALSAKAMQTLAHAGFLYRAPSGAFLRRGDVVR